MKSQHPRCAARLHELLQHVEACGEMLLTSPFHMLGIGNGVTLAAAFANRYGRQARYRDSMRSIVSINGFASVDTQLAAILHSSIKVFSSFPENRPDLPVSYFTKFLFSEDYLERVHPNLALNIHTAVANPITLEGRIKICRAALAGSSAAVAVAPENLAKPLIMLQCTEDMLVNAANVDPFLEGRAASHLWSHQIQMHAPESQVCRGFRPFVRACAARLSARTVLYAA